MWIWLTILGVVIAAEVWTVRTGRRPLSLVMRRAFVAWPFFGVCVGLIVGGLLVHFFWPYCP